MCAYRKNSFHEMTGTGKVLRITGMVLAGIAFAVAMAFIFGLVVQWIWNWLIPGLFGLSEITYWQAFGMIILGRIIFGGIGHPGHGHTSRKYEYMDQRRESRKNLPVTGDEDMSEYYSRFWKEEGRDAFDSYMKKFEEEKHEK